MATFTFTNSTGIAIPDAAATSQSMTVFGLAATVTDVSVTLTGLTHTVSEDLEMLLVSPDAEKNLEFWSDVGSGDDLDGNYVVSDTGSQILPNGSGIVPGTYRPADYDNVETGEDFGRPGLPIIHAGPNGSGTFASAFGSVNGNGEWGLYVRDSIALDVGHLNSWGLTITTSGSAANIIGNVDDDVITVTPTAGGNGTYTVSNLGTASCTGVTTYLVSGDYGIATFGLNCGNDTIKGTLGASGLVSGDVQGVTGAGIRAGNDILTVSAYIVYGDAFYMIGGTLDGGDDTIQAVATTVYGDTQSVLSGAFVGGGDDRITVTNGATVYGDMALVGGASSHASGGNDMITATGSAANLIFGDADVANPGASLIGGKDTIHGGGGGDTIYGDYRSVNAAFVSGGDDTLYGDAGSDTIYGNDGNDYIDGGTETDTMYGGRGNDTFVVDNAGDVVSEGLNSGSDTIYISVSYNMSAEVETLVMSGVGNLNTAGNALANTIVGNVGNNMIQGGNGADRILGGGGIDSLVGGQGADTISGEAGNDTIYGGTEGDAINGGAGSDSLSGDDGNDVIYGDDPGTANYSDAINGGAGADTILGFGGNDTLWGGADGDSIRGGEGNDVLRGEAGNDYLYGEGGADTFQYIQRGFNTDQIFDFQNGIDKMQMSKTIFANAGAAIAAATQMGGDVLINAGQGDQLILKNFLLANLTADDFSFF